MTLAPLLLIANLATGLGAFWPELARPAASATGGNEAAAEAEPAAREPSLLTPLVPGVTVPGSHIAYLFVTLLANAVFHELGHAFAALTEEVAQQFSLLVTTREHVR